MKRSTTVLIAVTQTIVATVAPGQTTYEWDGSQNNNWDNGPNWFGASGWPDDSTHTAKFDSINYGTNDTDVDLRGGTFDINNLSMTFADEPLEFRSSSGTGTLRVHGGLRFNNDNTSFGATHVFNINIVAVGETVWRSGFQIDLKLFELDGELSGSGPIRCEATAAQEGDTIAVIYGENPYSGDFIVENGSVELANPNALQNAKVAINWNATGSPYGIDTRDTPEGTIHFGAISGTGKFHSSGSPLTIKGTATRTHSGEFKGEWQGFEPLFTKLGAGDQTLAGEVIGWSQLRNEGSGDLHLSGSGNFGQAFTSNGELTFQNGVFTMDGINGNVLHVQGSATARIKSGAEVSLTGALGTNRVVVTNDGVISIEDTGSTLIAPRVDIGPSGSGTAQLLAQLGGTLQAGRLRIGDIFGDDGAAGDVSVLSGGSIAAEEISLFRRGTLLVFAEGSVSTDILADGDSEPHVITLSDPTDGAALTIGSGGGSSSVTAVIQDLAMSSGSVNKVGAGVLELLGGNTFSGGVVVSGGTLVAGNTAGSATGSGQVTLKTGTTLRGAGAIGGLIRAESGSTVAPGASPGILTAANITFDAGSVLDMELAGSGGNAGTDFDRLDITGTATLNGTLNLSAIGSFAAQPGDTFTVLTATAINGTFSSVTWPDAQDWFIQYTADRIIVGVALPIATGACCLSDGSCQSLSATDCLAQAGMYQGNDVDCNDASCPQPCPADIDGNGTADFDDLLTLLAAWGPCLGCPADINDSGTVDFDDLLVLLAAWGACG